ncbi:MAG: hypothetical protein F4020_05910 [Gammaproteobacteria bacterium]|nr:hypothetical protein [Gammaproteobacteria bacterium]
MGLDAPSRLPAEQVRKILRRGVAGVLGGQHVDANAHGGHREELGSDVDDAAQHGLALLEPRPEPEHAVEQGTRELARTALDESHVPCQAPEFRESGPAAPAHPARGIPPGIVQPGAHQRGHPLAQRRPRIHQGPGQFQVLVHRLARDEQAHDLARTLEDAIDAHVAEQALHGSRHLLAPGTQGIGGLVPAAAPHLDRVVSQGPGGFAVPELGHGGLDADVEGAGVGHHRRQLHDRFHGEGVRGHPAQHLRDGVVPAHRGTPLNPVAAPAAAHVQGGLAGRGAQGRKRQPARVQRDERELEAEPLSPEQVLARHPHVGEAQDSVG